MSTPRLDEPPRTPIRAISSKISTKLTPSLPSPTETYDPLVKTVFRHRLQLSLSVSAAYTYVVINAWTLWQAGGIAKVGLWGALWLLISPRTICTTFVAWMIMAVPVTVFRKLFLTCTYRLTGPHEVCSNSPLQPIAQPCRLRGVLSKSRFRNSAPGSRPWYTSYPQYMCFFCSL
jgi:hypothetical protein